MVARETFHFVVYRFESLAYLARHGNHFPGLVLHRLIVFFEAFVIRRYDVAEIAFYSQRSADLMHYRDHLVGRQVFQQLYVLKDLSGWAFRDLWTLPRPVLTETQRGKRNGGYREAQNQK
jgi:hypothetical protein